MSKAAQELRDKLSIFNPHNAAQFARNRTAVHAVYLSYRPAITGRASQSGAWQVIRPGFRTDPDTHWRNYGHKTFVVGWDGSTRASAEADARAWASERYGIAEWVKIPGLPGALFPREIADYIKKALREFPS